MENKYHIELQEVSLQDAIDNIVFDHDDYGIASYTMTSFRKRAFISNPNIVNKSKCMVCLIKANGIYVGRGMQFPILFKAGDVIINGRSGSSLKVHKDYRKTDAAIDIVMHPIQHKDNNVLIYADFSEDGINVYKALRFCIFEMQKMVRLNNFDYIFEKMGCPAWLVKLFSSISNAFLFFVNRIAYRIPKRLKQYEVYEVKKVPEWIDRIVLSEAKYMEVHDHKWMQWNLDNMFHQHDLNINRFFIIRKGNLDVGFFFLKERYRDFSDRKISPMLFGYIMEWGSTPESNLGEYDIYRLAIPHFSNKVDAIQIATSDSRVQKSLNRLFFKNNGLHHIVFKDLTKKFKDAKEPSLWRLRYGYSDSIFN